MSKVISVFLLLATLFLPLTARGQEEGTSASVGAIGRSYIPIAANCRYRYNEIHNIGNKGGKIELFSAKTCIGKKELNEMVFASDENRLANGGLAIFPATFTHANVIQVGAISYGGVVVLGIGIATVALTSLNVALFYPMTSYDEIAFAAANMIDNNTGFLVTSITESDARQVTSSVPIGIEDENMSVTQSVRVSYNTYGYQTNPRKVFDDVNGPLYIITAPKANDVAPEKVVASIYIESRSLYWVVTDPGLNPIAKVMNKSRAALLLLAQNISPMPDISDVTKENAPYTIYVDNMVYAFTEYDNADKFVKNQLPVIFLHASYARPDSGLVGVLKVGFDAFWIVNASVYNGVYVPVSVEPTSLFFPFRVEDIPEARTQANRIKDISTKRVETPADQRNSYHQKTGRDLLYFPEENENYKCGVKRVRIESPNAHSISRHPGNPSSPSSAFWAESQLRIAFRALDDASSNIGDTGWNWRHWSVKNYLHFGGYYYKLGEIVKNGVTYTAVKKSSSFFSRVLVSDLSDAERRVIPIDLSYVFPTQAYVCDRYGWSQLTTFTRLSDSARVYSIIPVSWDHANSPF